MIVGFTADNLAFCPACAEVLYAPSVYLEDASIHVNDSRGQRVMPIFHKFMAPKPLECRHCGEPIPVKVGVPA